METASIGISQALTEHAELEKLKGHVADLLDLSPLTKALINNHMAGIQETLRLAWGIEIEEIKDPGFMEIPDTELEHYKIQMKTTDGQWAEVNKTSFGEIPSDMLIRFMRESGALLWGPNDRMEFLLAIRPTLIDNIWTVVYQV